MVNSIFSKLSKILVLMTGLILSVQAMAALTASVDRTHLAEYETLELTLRTDSDTSAAPDLSPLENDFDILGTRQSRQIRIINGRNESWRDWVVTLSPKKSGRLLIPSLQLDGMTSKAIRLEVSDTPTEQKAGPGGIDPVFIRTEVSDEKPYVQQEVILTLKIYYRVQLYDDRRLSPLNIDGAIVQQLGETRNYETVLDGTRYGVFELNFSIHPQKPGSVDIPGLTFSATMPDDRRDSFGSIFSMSGKPVAARSAEITLNVRPQPESFKGSVWLPARKLTLTDGWSAPLDKIKVGDAITRTIVVEAEGLTGVQLPAVTMPKLDGVSAYTDKSTSDDKATDSGVIGSRIEAIALIPTRPGKIELPPVQYQWFDTDAQTEKVATIPAKTITVHPSENPEVLTTTPEIPVQTTEKTEETVCPPAIANITTQRPFWLWPSLSALFGLLWLITLLVLWRCRSSQKPAVESSDIPKSQGFSEKEAWQEFESACNTEDLNQIRGCFVKWVQTLSGNSRLTTMDRCLKKLNSDPLVTSFNRLEANLYSGHEQKLDTKALISLCKQLRKEQKNGESSHQNGLNSLYPD
ncbi:MULTISPECIES: BatD family protein [unclassified Endozoicomonas]|uniref:BatD family protein n=1 Tax=unclassified Endozoicomonas TaxID=2644528 RepID=UPI002148A601|nr:MULTISPECIES: BatD family protein [unclassified Endozoicomonas]